MQHLPIEEVETLSNILSEAVTILHRLTVARAERVFTDIGGDEK